MEADTCLTILLRVASRILGRPIEAGQDFFAQGGDSLLAVELLTVLEEELCVEIDEEAVFGANSMREMADCLAAAAP